MSAILRDGFESGEIRADGWNTFAGPLPEAVSTITTTNSRKDINGFGGDYFCTYDVSTRFSAGAIKPFARQCREGFIKIALNVATTSFINNSGPFFLAGGGETILSSTLINSDTVIRFIRGSFPVILTSDTGTLSPDNQWHVYLLHYYIDNVNGFYKLYRDYNFDSPVGTYNGDTKATTANFADSFGFTASGRDGSDMRIGFDDIAVNDITMTYSGGAGTLPVIGDTILGQTSTARAIVSAVIPGSTTSDGTLQLRNVLDGGLVDWTGIQSDDPFVTETIDDSLSSNLWTANIVGLDKNSGFPSNGYIFSLQPTADEPGKIQLSNTGIGGNFADVAPIPPDDADFVFSSISGDRDIYDVENIAAATGLSPGDIGSIATVTLKTRWQKSDPALNYGRLIIQDSGVEYDSEQLTLPLGTFDSAEQIYDKIPDGTPNTATDWDATSVDALKIGVKFEA